MKDDYVRLRVSSLFDFSVVAEPRKEAEITKIRIKFNGSKLKRNSPFSSFCFLG